ncbi:hypothetical protein O2651_002410, partial [Salmonella enterica]|nr:hypothetical protein [Salmonella enterica]EHP7219492.1 hypothetical protein [Salmonella enterica subsp. enterica serovar Thompson]EFQ5635752.1 hypothetical protein [Salmonella enterica]EFR3014549.1 hypothetical protein [Salmonella enterica]EFS0981186.1 hypothetical protein [Salmonella enterica]
EAFSQAKQRYGAPRLAEEVNLGPEVQCKNDSVQPAVRVCGDLSPEQFENQNLA